MAQVLVTATRTVEQTKTVEIKIRITDVKEWLRENYGTPSEHGMDWDDPSVLEEYLQEHEELIDEAEGDIDDINEDWEIQNAETA